MIVLSVVLCTTLLALLRSRPRILSPPHFIFNVWYNRRQFESRGHFASNGIDMCDWKKVIRGVLFVVVALAAVSFAIGYKIQTYINNPTEDNSQDAVLTVIILVVFPGVLGCIFCMNWCYEGSEEVARRQRRKQYEAINGDIQQV